MLIRANATAFHAAVATTAAAIERRTSVPVLSGVKLVARKGRLTLTATDMEMEVTRDLGAKIERPGAVVVDGRRLCRLLDAIRKVDAGTDVSLSSDDGVVVLAWGDSTARLFDLDADNFPSLDHTPTAAHRVPARQLLDLLARVAPMMSTESNRYYLNGVYLHDRSGHLAATATDGHRLAIAGTSDPLAPGWPGLIVPRLAVRWITEALRRLDAETEVMLEPSATQLAVSWPGVRLVTKAIDATFPDYDRVVPAPSTPCTVERAALRRALRLIAAFSEGLGAPTVGLDLSEGRMVLSVTAGEGAITTTIPADYAGVPISRGFNLGYLRGVVALLRSPTLTISGEDHDAPHRIESADDPDLLLILMPRRI